MIYYMLVYQAEASDFPGNYHGYDDTWSFEKFKKVLGLLWLTSGNIMYLF